MDKYRVLSCRDGSSMVIQENELHVWFDNAEQIIDEVKKEGNAVLQLRPDWYVIVSKYLN